MVFLWNTKRKKKKRRRREKGGCLGVNVRKNEEYKEERKVFFLSKVNGNVFVFHVKFLGFVGLKHVSDDSREERERGRRKDRLVY